MRRDRAILLAGGLLALVAVLLALALSGLVPPRGDGPVGDGPESSRPRGAEAVGRGEETRSSSPAGSPGSRSVSWPVLAGEVAPPADGSRIRLWTGSGRSLLDARVVNGRLVATGLPRRYGVLRAEAPDGSLAMPFLPPAGAEGPAFAFAVRRRVEVVLRDEDGMPVAGIDLAPGDHGFDPHGPRGRTDASGRGVLDGLFGESTGIWAIDESSPHGYYLGHVEMDEATSRLEAPLPRPREVVLRIRVDGRPAVPEGVGLFTGREPPARQSIDRLAGEIRFWLRPRYPGRPLRVELRAPGFPTVSVPARATDPRGPFHAEIDLR